MVLVVAVGVAGVEVVVAVDKEVLVAVAGVVRSMSLLLLVVVVAAAVVVVAVGTW